MVQVPRGCEASKETPCSFKNSTVGLPLFVSSTSSTAAIASSTTHHHGTHLMELDGDTTLGGDATRIHRAGCVLSGPVRRNRIDSFDESANDCSGGTSTAVV